MDQSQMWHLQQPLQLFLRREKYQSITKITYSNTIYLLLCPLSPSSLISIPFWNIKFSKPPSSLHVSSSLPLPLPPPPSSSKYWHHPQPVYSMFQLSFSNVKPKGGGGGRNAKNIWNTWLQTINYHLSNAGPSSNHWNSSEQYICCKIGQIININGQNPCL